MEHPPGCPCAQFALSASDDNIVGLVDLASVRGFNEAKPGSAKELFRTEADKWLFDAHLAVCASPAKDPELLIHLVFKEGVRLRAINLVAAGHAVPDYVGVYVNEEHVAFDLTAQEPYQRFDAPHFSPKWETELTPTPIKGGFLRSLTLHFRSSAPSVGLQYIGLKGYGNKSRRGVVEAEYELVPTADKKRGETDLRHPNFAGGF